MNNSLQSNFYFWFSSSISIGTWNINLDLFDPFLSWWYHHSRNRSKAGLSPSKKNFVICLIEIPLKMMNNTFYFILKALFILGIFKFLSWLLGHVGKIYFNVYLQIRLTSKFMTSQPGFQTMAIYLLSTILQSKGNQTMKFGQLIK